MLIFQPHLPHIIWNSRRQLYDLNHLKIIFWKAWFPYQHVSLKSSYWPQVVMIQILLNVLVYNKTMEKCPC